MTIDDIRPTLGTYYRRRASGDLAVVRRYADRTDPHHVRLVSDHGHEWVMTIADFWADWIHADLYDPERN